MYQRTYNNSRFIPTCVGNIFSSDFRASKAAVHPHVCGEHSSVCAVAGTHDGSSPRVWGTYDEVCANNKNGRFIPTCVGNIALSWRALLFRPVHPHVCGEHLFTAICRQILTGSSPRVWGTFAPVMWAKPEYRFIPTCVGNMATISIPANQVSVHPHVCGEHHGQLVCNVLHCGSSPRVWGT